MRVLITSELETQNPFIDNLSKVLDKYACVTTSVAAFYERKQKFDVVNIHWIEAFTNWKNPSLSEYNKVLDHLARHKSCSRIVLTRHNAIPHEIRSDLMLKLYVEVCKSADCIIHLGEFSKVEYLNKYRFAQTQQHLVIPHGNYDYINNRAPYTSRIRLGLKNNSFVALAFGQIRTFDEKVMLIKMFKALPYNNKVFLAPGWGRSTQPSIIKNPLKRLYAIVLDIILGIKKEYLIDSIVVPEENIQDYFNASNLVLIPRVESLNSGVVVLAYNFAKPVISVKGGNIGEIISTTDNYFIENQRMPSLIELRNQGKTNLTYANKNWVWNKLYNKKVVMQILTGR